MNSDPEADPGASCAAIRPDGAAVTGRSSPNYCTTCLPRRVERACPALVLNAVRGALDARLTSLGGAVMSSRSPLTVAIWSASIFTVAGFGFPEATEDPSVMSAGNQHGLSAMFAVLVSAAAIALAAMVAVAVPAAVAMVRGRGKGTWWLLAVPPAAILIWYGILQLAFVIAGHRQLDSARNISAVILVIVAGLGVVAGRPGQPTPRCAGWAPPVRVGCDRSR